MKITVYNEQGIPCGVVDIPFAVADAADMVGEWMEQNNVTQLGRVALRFPHTKEIRNAQRK